MNICFKLIVLLHVFAILNAFISTSFNCYNSIQKSHQFQSDSKLFSTVNKKTIGNKEVSAVTLKNLVLTDYKGEKRRISDLIKKDKSVIVFLRHLGNKKYSLYNILSLYITYGILHFT